MVAPILGDHQSVDVSRGDMPRIKCSMKQRISLPPTGEVKGTISEDTVQARKRTLSVSINYLVPAVIDVIGVHRSVQFGWYVNARVFSRRANKQPSMVSPKTEKQFSRLAVLRRGSYTSAISHAFHFACPMVELDPRDAQIKHA